MRPGRKRAAGIGAGLAAGLLGSLASAEAPRSPFLHVVPIQTAQGVDPALPILVALHTEDPERIRSALRPEAVKELGPDRIVLRLERYPGRGDGDPSKYRAPTFLVDFDSPSVEALAASARERLGAAPGVAELVAYTRELILASGERGFDVASEVAEHRSGDCTEHAVLFAALARRFGHPTRIAIGTVLVAAEGRIYAFGHAWTEVHDGRGWAEVDPTDIQGAHPIAHVPEGIVENEGPGFTLGLFDLISANATRVEVLGNAGANPK